MILLYCVFFFFNALIESDNFNNTGIKICWICERLYFTLEFYGLFITGDVILVVVFFN